MSVCLIPDVWDEVCQHLQRGDLHNICLTSRTLNHIGTLYLYRRIQWDWNEKDSRKRIMELWATLTQDEGKRRRLCGYVQEVQLQMRSPPEGTAAIFESPEIQKRYLHVASEVKMPFYWEINYLRGVVSSVIQDGEVREAWYKYILARNPYALVALLLPFLHNLRSLQLDYLFLIKGGLPAEMINYLTSGTEIESAELRNNLDHLETMDYGTNAVNINLTTRSEYKYDLCHYSTQFVPIFRLQNVKHLRIWLRSWYDLHLKRLIGFKTDYTALESFVLDHMSVKECSFLEILQGMKNLRSLHLGFNVESRTHWAESPRPTQADQTRLSNGLQALYGCLEHLSISLHTTPEYREQASEDIVYRPLFENLTADFFQSFTRLKTLELPIRILNGFEDIAEVGINRELPATLERLGLRWDFRHMGMFKEEEPDTVGDLKGIVADFLQSPGRHLRVPLLQEVIIRLWLSDDELDKTLKDCDDLIEEFNIHVGVRFDLMRPGLWTKGH
ncbi:hypothetical protein AbraIFM66950_000301 [Aspergillus brasiliensis]|nr:hypothetical protein AbraIFM66950_000301 [Aspergillus brasiliensis]